MSNYVYLKDRNGKIIQTESPHYWPDAVRLTKKEGEKAHKAQLAAHLRKYFKPGDTAYTQLLSVSSSGMSRHIAVIGAERRSYTDGNGKKRAQMVPVDLSATVAELLDYKTGKRGGIVVGGCGMDMGFHIIYAMSSRMFPNGTAKPHGRRNGEPDSDGGYAIKHSWL